MFPRHEEFSGIVDATADDAFAHLDNPPRRKVCRTVGEPRLLVIGAYEMGFELAPAGNGVRLRVAIDYEWPTKRLQRFLGRLFGRMYAKWCTRQMVQDAQKTFRR